MFEWLEREISAIKTPRFHCVEGPMDPKLQDAVLGSSLSLPLSYKNFVLRFGNAKLYRNSRNDSYRIGVFASPREATLDDGSHIYHIGFHHGASVYVKPVTASGGFPIFEFEGGLEEKVADNFEEWLRVSCAGARSTYGANGWEKILRGPSPFTPKEEEIINARRLMHWKVLGVDNQGNHIFQVTNTSPRPLSALTVGVRSKNGRLNGAVRLNTAHIAPGGTDVLHVDCYKNLVPLDQIELFALPDPKPEDREYYWELRGDKVNGNQ